MKIIIINIALCKWWTRTYKNTTQNVGANMDQRRNPFIKENKTDIPIIQKR